MASLNKVCLIGNLGKDPKISVLKSGGKVVSFSIATSENWKDKSSGERRERTEWHNIVIFNEALVGIAEKYLKKGSRCYIEGAMQTRKYTDTSGVDKYATEVVLPAFRGNLLLLDKADRAPPAEDDYGTTRAKPASPQPAPADLDDEIPF